MWTRMLGGAEDAEESEGFLNLVLSCQRNTLHLEQKSKSLLPPLIHTTFIATVSVASLC